MILIQRLKRPNKRSGVELKPKAKTTMRGLVIVNQNDFPVRVDKWTRKRVKKKK